MRRGFFDWWRFSCNQKCALIFVPDERVLLEVEMLDLEKEIAAALKSSVSRCQMS